MSKKTSIPTYNGERADVRHLKNTENGPRVKVSHPDGREWVCVVAIPDGEISIEVTRRDGTPADIDIPTWLTDNLGHLAAA
jgi:hypothetical protein